MHATRPLSKMRRALTVSIVGALAAIGFGLSAGTACAATVHAAPTHAASADALPGNGAPKGS